MTGGRQFDEKRNEDHDAGLQQAINNVTRLHRVFSMCGYDYSHY